jgi:SNF2 family DNA or RNA helicase
MKFFITPENTKRVHKESAEAIIIGIYAGAMAIVGGLLIIDIIKTAFRNSVYYEKTMNVYERVMGRIFGRIRVKNNMIYIKGINHDTFLDRITSMFNERSLDKAFDRKFGFFQQLLYEGKIIKKRTNIKYLKVPLFFALELINLFQMLEETYNMPYYGAMGRAIYLKTPHYKNFKISESIPSANLSVLDSQLNSAYKLKPYQAEFISNYEKLKTLAGLRGLILSFDQGLGKTLTSLALAKVLGHERVLIVCPNTLRENWKREIAMYFQVYANQELADREIYIHKVSNPKYLDTAKYLVFNQEALDVITSTVKPASINMLIIDESHNFRNMTGTRTSKLLEFLNLLTPKSDILPMSGTPIKATPAELAPMLTLLDPLFDVEAGKMFSRIFDVDTESTSKLIATRFAMTIYRKVKSEVLELPPKNERFLSFGVKNFQQYRLEIIRGQVMSSFEAKWPEAMMRRTERMERYIYFIRTYSRAGSAVTEQYIRYLQSGVFDEAGKANARSRGKNTNRHDLTIQSVETFPEKYVLPYITNDQAKEFKQLHTEFINIRRSLMAKSLGEIYPKKRSKMYSSMIEENIPTLVSMIDSAAKKTIIFSTMLEVVHTAHALLDPIVGTVKVVGGNSDKRFDALDAFKYEDTKQVLCATSQTLATGVTLTEANQVIFFGTPWRSSDFQQASDRVYRIGQTHPVDIYIATLPDTEPNLSSRMNDILKWSESMFGAMVDDTTLDKGTSQ